MRFFTIRQKGRANRSAMCREWDTSSIFGRALAPSGSSELVKPRLGSIDLLPGSISN